MSNDQPNALRDARAERHLSTATFVVPLLAYVAIYFADGTGFHPSGDGYYSWVFARSLVFDGDVDFGNDYALCGDPFRVGVDRGSGHPDNPFYAGPAAFWMVPLGLLRLVFTIAAGAARAESASCAGWMTALTILTGPLCGALSILARLQVCSAAGVIPSGGVHGAPLRLHVAALSVLDERSALLARLSHVHGLRAHLRLSPDRRGRAAASRLALGRRRYRNRRPSSPARSALRGDPPRRAARARARPEATVATGDGNEHRRGGRGRPHERALQAPLRQLVRDPAGPLLRAPFACTPVAPPVRSAWGLLLLDACRVARRARPRPRAPSRPPSPVRARVRRNRRRGAPRVVGSARLARQLEPRRATALAALAVRHRLLVARGRALLRSRTAVPLAEVPAPGRRTRRGSDAREQCPCVDHDPG